MKVARILQHVELHDIPLCLLREMTGKHNFNLFHLVKIPPKWRKSTDHDQNVISYLSGEDTYTSMSQCVLREMPRNHNVVSLSQNAVKMDRPWQNLISFKGVQNDQYVKFQALHLMCSQKIPGIPKFSGAFFIKHFGLYIPKIWQVILEKWYVVPNKVNIIL